MPVPDCLHSYLLTRRCRFDDVSVSPVGYQNVKAFGAIAKLSAPAPMASAVAVFENRLMGQQQSKP